MTDSIAQRRLVLVDKTYDVLNYDIHDLYLLKKESNSYSGGYTQESTLIGPSIYYNVAGWVAIQQLVIICNFNRRETRCPIIVTLIRYFDFNANGE